MNEGRRGGAIPFGATKTKYAVDDERIIGKPDVSLSRGNLSIGASQGALRVLRKSR
jgi:hypothetical protein